MNTLTYLKYLATRNKVRDMSLQSRRVLMILSDTPGLTNKQIAKRCFTTENSISVTLAKLQADGVIGNNTLNTRHNSWYILDREIEDMLAINSRTIGV